MLTFTANVWGGQSSTSVKCGQTDVTGIPTFVSGTAALTDSMDLHLAGGAGLADNLVPAALCTPKDDIDGVGEAGGPWLRRRRRRALTGRQARDLSQQLRDRHEPESSALERIEDLLTATERGRSPRVAAVVKQDD